MTRFVLAAVAVLTSAAAASAADYPFTVTVVGTGRPVVFVPGFGCSGKVWDTTVAHFKDKCECHVLTLAGFAGVPPVKGDGPFLDTAVKGIADYARDKNLSDAVVIGHSLGAYVAVRVAEVAPDQFTAAVLVDGFPAFAGLLPDVKPEEWAKMAAARRERLAKATRDEYLAEMRAMFTPMMAADRLEEAMTWLAATDQETAAKARSELVLADARPDLAKVRGPVVMLAAYNAEIKKYGVPDAAEWEKRVTAQLAGAKDGRAAVHPDCRHFIMYEQPKWLFEKIEGVLKK